MPIDVEVALGVSKGVDEVNYDEIIFDIGPKTLNLIQEKVASSQYIVWNGPLGKYQDGFSVTTKALAQSIIQNKGAESLVGGGDTLVVLDQDTLSQFSFVSTGGGAMLDFLANETLPGIEALS
jgi:phosphoglycerate kinase